MERKTFGFEVKDIDEEAGTFTGYAATFAKKPDSYGDVIDPGAFTKTLKEHSKRVKILWNHIVHEPIGKPLELSVDDNGLLIKGKLSLGVQRAREVLSLMKDGVVTEMSFGYDTIKDSWEDGLRHLQEVRLWDVSPVTFAANPAAVVLSVKKATAFADLPLADREREWDAMATERRIRAWAGGEEDMNWNKYRQAFFWYDEESPELFGSYKLGFADIIDNKLTAIPRGIFAVGGVLMGARGGVAISEADAVKVKSHVEKYYAKMAKEWDDETIIAPWNKAGAEPIEEKTGRVLSASTSGQIQSAIDALQALLDTAEGEEEPEKSTLLSEADKEAEKLEAVVLALKAENEGFDTKEAEQRIETILAQLKQ